MDHPIFSLWQNVRFNIHRGWSRRRRFLRHALKKRKTNSLEHGCATTHDSGVRFLTYVDVTLLLLVRSVVESAGSSINEVWLEQYFRAVETFSANSGDVSVWENVGLALADDLSTVS